MILSFPRLFCNSTKLPQCLFFILISIVALLVACRVDVGADWSNYVDLYNLDELLYDDVSRIEPLYRLLRWIFYPLGFSCQGYFFIISMFMMCTVYWITKKFRISNYYLAFWIYISTIFCSYQLNTIRSGLMASCVWIAFVFLSEGDRRKAVVWALIGTGFHYAGFAFLPCLYFIDKKVKRNLIFLILCVSYIILISGIGTKVLEMIPFLAAFERLSKYTDSSTSVAAGISLGNIMNLCVYLYCLFIFKSEYESSTKYRVLMNSFLFCLILTAVFNAFSTIVSRIGQVLNMSLIFIWPFIFVKVKSLFFKLGLFVFFAAYLYMYYMKAFQINEFIGYCANVPFQFKLTGFFR